MLHDYVSQNEVLKVVPEIKVPPPQLPQIKSFERILLSLNKTLERSGNSTRKETRNLGNNIASLEGNVRALKKFSPGILFF